MSMLASILSETAAAESALALVVEGNTLTAVVRKLPKHEETVDPPYQVFVSGAEQVDQVKRIAFGSRWQALYQVEITLITPGDHDAAINLEAHADWREATRAWFQKPKPLSTPGVKRVEIIQAPFLNRAQLAKGYDYNQVVIQVTTYEERL